MMFARFNNKLRINILKLNICKSYSHMRPRSTDKNLLLGPAPILTKRTFFNIFMKPSHEQLKLRDGIPKEYQIIYNNKMERYAYAIQIITTLTAGVLLIGFSLQGNLNWEIDYESWSSVTRKTENESFIFISVFVFIIVVLQMFVTSFPIRIYKIPKTSKHIFVMNRNWPFSTKKIRCLAGDLKHVSTSKLLPWSDSKYLIKKGYEHHTVILIEPYFRRPADLHILTGNQKDPELNETT